MLTDAFRSGRYHVQLQFLYSSGLSLIPVLMMLRVRTTMLTTLPMHCAFAMLVAWFSVASKADCWSVALSVSAYCG